MRNGNYQLKRLIKLAEVVLILPMRNGNFSNKFEAYLNEDRSYPTYEEWKLGSIKPCFSITLVLILPMRNGNNEMLKQAIIPYKFLSYL